jgi:hypothetical protein
MPEVSQAEFQRWMERLHSEVQGVNARLDVLNGRTRQNETDIAVLKDRSAGGSAAAWGGGIGAVVVAVAESLRWYFGSKP